MHEYILGDILLMEVGLLWDSTSVPKTCLQCVFEIHLILGYNLTWGLFLGDALGLCKGIGPHNNKIYKIDQNLILERPKK